jgi:flavin-dependent dehydrogenase
MIEKKRNPEQYDAIIIGGGLSGLNAAYFLSKEGYRVILFERLPKKGLLDHPCGSMISPVKDFITFEHSPDGIVFKELDFVFPKELILDYPGIMEFKVPNGQTFGMNIKNPRDRLIFQIDKPKTLHLLAERAEKAGAKLIYGTNVSKLVMEGDGVKGVQTRDGLVRAPIVLSGEGLSRRFSRQTNLYDEPAEGYIFTYALYVKDLTLEKNKRGQFGYFGENVVSAPKSSVIFHSYGKEQALIFISLYLDTFQWPYDESVEVFLKEALTNIPYLTDIANEGHFFDKKACWIKMMKPSTLVAPGFIGMGDSVAPYGHSSNAIAMLMGKNAAETATNALEANNYRPPQLRDYDKWLNSDLFKGVEFEGHLISELLSFTDEELNTLGKVFSDIDLESFFIGTKWQMLRTPLKMMFKKGVIKNWQLFKRLF